MKNKKLAYGIISVCIVAAALIIVLVCFYLPSGTCGGLFAKTEKCGIENCHGLDLSCGSDVPEACTELYALGDNCRQFADCEVVDGACQLKKEPEFDECVSCVEQCLEDSKDDIADAFECENRCYTFE